MGAGTGLYNIILEEKKRKKLIGVIVGGDETSVVQVVSVKIRQIKTFRLVQLQQIRQPFQLFLSVCPHRAFASFKLLLPRAAPMSRARLPVFHLLKSSGSRRHTQHSLPVGFFVSSFA